jgi:Fe2+ transport system protein FeoA
VNQSTKTRTLREMKSGQRGRIVSFHADDPSYLHKVMALGVLPGEQMEVLQTFPAYVIKVGHTQLALDKHLAQIVEVEIQQ